MKTAVIGVDIGGSHISSLPLLPDGEVYRPCGALRTTKVDGYASREAILAGWSAHLNEQVAACADFSGRLAVAMPGPFDYRRGIAEFGAEDKFAALGGLSMTESMLGTSTSFSGAAVAGAREVVWSNDAACFGLGESLPYAAQGYHRVLAITLGTGVGSAFIAEGSIVTEGPGIPPGGEVYTLPFADARADDYFSTRWFVGEAAQSFGCHVAGVKELIAEAPPMVTRQIFDIFTVHLKILLKPLLVAFRPQVVVLGGNIARAWDYFAPDLDRWLAEKDILLRPAQGGERSACLGAALAGYPLRGQNSSL